MLDEPEALLSEGERIGTVGGRRLNNCRALRFPGCEGVEWRLGHKILQQKTNAAGLTKAVVLATDSTVEAKCSCPLQARRKIGLFHPKHSGADAGVGLKPNRTKPPARVSVA